MDLVTPLKAYIDARFAGRDAADAADDLAVIQGLRAEVVANALTSPDARRDLLLRCAALRPPLRGTRDPDTRLGGERRPRACLPAPPPVCVVPTLGRECRADTPFAPPPLRHRYYRALLLIEARFPIGKAKDAVNKLSFTWCVGRSCVRPNTRRLFLRE